MIPIGERGDFLLLHAHAGGYPEGGGNGGKYGD